jgi:prephenate dehydrogenase
VPNFFDDNRLSQITIIGVGLLGGSIGLALKKFGFTGQRVGVGRRAESLQKALDYGAVDTVTQDVVKGVTGADLVILATPIGHFEALMRAMNPVLGDKTLVTDVASTKAEVVRLARRHLSRNALFLGSHPMAGSEKTGVEYARADLFERALCLVTPTKSTPAGLVAVLEAFWQALGGRTQLLTPSRHDELMARASHLPHAVAAALVKIAVHDRAIDVGGPGFGDTTRIAGGDPAMWTDIFRTNRKAVCSAVGELISELKRFRDRLARDDAEAILDWLEWSRRQRDAWVDRRYQKEEFPT